MSNWDTSTGQVSRAPMHQCDHTNCIPRSELPGLPDGIAPGFTARNLREMEWETGDWEWLAALLNTCYPAPTATGDGDEK